MKIHADNVGYIYSKGSVLEHEALKGISFELSNRGVLGVLGAAASGKTTLLKTLNGLFIPTSGTIRIDGEPTHKWGPELRKKVGLVFQRPEYQFFEDTVYKDISYGLRIEDKLTDREIMSACVTAAESIGLDLECVAQTHPMELGGSDKRKAAIACVIVNEPEILILDEPLVGLDPYSKRGLVADLLKIKEKGVVSLVIVSHDMEDFFFYLDQLLVLESGRQLACGNPWEIIKRLKGCPSMAELIPGLPRLTLDILGADTLHIKGLDAPESARKAIIEVIIEHYDTKA